jgi:cyclase
VRASHQAVPIAFCLAASMLLQGQSEPQPARPAQNMANAEVHILPVQGNIYMLVGAGGNITVQIGKDGVLLVDSGFEQTTDKVLAAIQTLSKGSIRYIINTHVHGDHTGGNQKIAQAGKTIAGGNVVGDIGKSAGEGAAVIAHEKVLNRMSAPTGSQSPTPQGAWPTDTFFGNQKNLFVNGEGIEILHIPDAHTDGDSIVFFRRSDVISAGDVFTPERYPIVDVQRGGNVQGLIAALNEIIHLSIPAEKQEGGTLVIPGHGRLCDQADVVVYRDMVTIVRDRVRDMIKKGMTLEQVKAAKPTLDYDPLYAAPNRPPDSFIEAVYKSLSDKK